MKSEITDCGRAATKPQERADCTVRAVSACMGITYEDAWSRMAEFGRGPRKRFKFSVAAEKFGLTRRPELSCKTLVAILPELQSGRFIVRKSGHVFAVVNGVVIDMAAPKERSRVQMVYEFAPQPEIQRPELCS